MAILIDGIVSEATDLKIPTMTPGEIERIKEQWGSDDFEKNKKNL